MSTTVESPKDSPSGRTTCSPSGERILFKIQDGLGTTRAHQMASTDAFALAQYAVSVGVPSDRLRLAGWRAVAADDGIRGYRGTDAMTAIGRK